MPKRTPKETRDTKIMKLLKRLRKAANDLEAKKISSNQCNDITKDCVRQLNDINGK